MMSSFATKSYSSPPKRPNPDQTSSPDKVRKTNILNTSSPKIQQKLIKKSNDNDQFKTAKQESKKLTQQNSKLNNKNKEQKQELTNLKNQIKLLKKQNSVLRNETTNLLGSDFRGIGITKQSFYQNLQEGKPKKIEYESLDKDSKQQVFQQFNRQLNNVSRKYESKLNQIQLRLDKISSSHKSLTQYLIQNKIDQIKFSSVKRNINSLSSPRLQNKSFKKQDLVQSRTASKYESKHKNILKQLQNELLFVKNQNKQLMNELKIKNNMIKQSVINKSRGRKHSLEDVRARQYSKVSISDFNQPKLNESQLKKQLQKIVQQLKNQKSSKYESQRALQVIQNNYQLSQQNLQLMRKQNQKLKQSNWNLNKQLENNKKIIHKMSQSMVKLDSNENKKHRFSQIMNKTNFKNNQNSPTPPKHSQSQFISYEEENLTLKNKNKRLENQINQLYLLRRKYQEQNIILYEQLRTIENAVNRHLYSSNQYQNHKGIESSRKRDIQYQMIQKTLQGIMNKLKLFKKEA